MVLYVKISYSKSIFIYPIDSKKIDEKLCEKHKDKLKLFCFNCVIPVCVMCSHYETDHEGHQIKPVTIAIDLARNEK